MKTIQKLISSFIIGLMPLGLSALVFLLGMGMFFETLVVSIASTLLGAVIMFVEF